MTIKLILFCSVASLAFVSGAHAADAVVAAEPEPMDYVRVCDAYGNGYWYIPGTETCLKVGGQFRYEKSWFKFGGQKAAFGEWSRGRIEVTAKNDSEWGTVSSWIRIEGSHSDNRGGLTGQVSDPATGKPVDVYSGANVGFNYTFGIGGLEFGYYDSQFAQFGGYGGRTDLGGNYINWAFGTRQYISYTAEFDSIKAVLSVEHDRNLNFIPGKGDGSDRTYMPDVVGGLSATFGDWSVTGVAAYDESDQSVAIAKFIRGDLGMFGVTVAGFYSNSATNTYITYDGFSGLVGASVQITDTVKLATDLQVWDNEDILVVGDLSWQVASGFSVLVEGSYFRDNDLPDTKAAMLRFERSF